MWYIKKPPKLKKAHSEGRQRLLDMLDAFINDNEGSLVEILYRTWEDQALVVTYKEIREWIAAGDITSSSLEQFQQDYSRAITTKFQDIWHDALQAGADSTKWYEWMPDGFRYDPNGYGIRDWITNKSATLVKDITDQQREAIRQLTKQSVRERMSYDELARVIRPTIGLNNRQAAANLRYYEHVKETLKSQHPRMRQETIERRAADSAAKYAAKQHRYRAQTIAMDQLADTYNHGADFAIRQAQRDGFIGKVRKRWVSAHSGNVCPICEGLDGMEIDLDDFFDAGLSEPRAHPRCRCVLEYIIVDNNELPEMPDEYDTDAPQEAHSLNTGERVYYDSSKTYEVVVDGYSARTNRAISEASKELAKRGTIDGFEHGVLIDINTGERGEFFSSGMPLAVHIDYKFINEGHDNVIFIHNHCVATELSLQDIATMAHDKEINAVAAVRNDGIITLAKSNGAKTSRYLRLKYSDTGQLKAVEDRLKNQGIYSENNVEIELRNIALEEFCSGGMKTYGTE